MIQHNTSSSKATKPRLPLKLIYYEAYLSEKDAKDREFKLKRFAGSYTHLKHRIKNSLILSKWGAGSLVVEYRFCKAKIAGSIPARSTPSLGMDKQIHKMNLLVILKTLRKVFNLLGNLNFWTALDKINPFQVRGSTLASLENLLDLVIFYIMYQVINPAPLEDWFHQYMPLAFIF